MPSYSKILIFVLVVCVFRCFSFSCYGSNEEEQQQASQSGRGTNSVQVKNDEFPLSKYSVAFTYSRLVKEHLTELHSNEETKIMKWMHHKEYEKVISYLEEKIASEYKSLDLIWKNNLTTSSSYLGLRLGKSLSLLSEALECDGRFRESRNLKGVFIQNSRDLHWQDARHEYSQGNLEGALESVYNAVYDNYAFWNLDAAFERDRTGRDLSQYSRESMLSRAEYKRIYELKDECVRVVCRDFSWKNEDFHGTKAIKGRTTVLKQYNHCFQEFMQFIEDEYSMLISRDDPNYCMLFELPDPEFEGTDEPSEPFLYNEYYEKVYGPMVEQFRKLAKLP